MLRYLAEQEAQNQQSFLELIGAPQSAINQYNQSSQFPADVLYGAYGDIPGTALSQQGAAFGSAANDLSGIFGQQLAYNANIQAQEMAHQRAMAALSSASSAGGGGSDGGLTPYQQASLEMRAMEFAAEQERYGRQDELDWLKFEAELEQDELERQEKENQAAADSLLYMAVLNPELLNNKKFMNRLGAALGMGSASAAGALTGAVTGGREAAAEARADALAGRRDKRDDIRSMIGSEFDSFEGNNKKLAVSSIMGAIETKYPGFAGWKRDKVLNMVRQHVNSQWATRDRSGQRGVGQIEVGSRISSAFTDFTQSIDTPTVDRNFLRRYRNVQGYRQAMSRRAVSSITGAIRDSMTRQQWNKNKVRITKLVRNYVRRNAGQFKVNRRPAPVRNGGGGGNLGR